MGKNCTFTNPRIADNSKRASVRLIEKVVDSSKDKFTTDKVVIFGCNDLLKLWGISGDIDCILGDVIHFLNPLPNAGNEHALILLQL